MSAYAPSRAEDSERRFEPEQRMLLVGVPWNVYASLRDALDEAGSHVQLTYFAGDLELMSPSSDHEETKVLLGRLLEVWCLDNGIDLFPLGSTTQRSQVAARGLEADESYCVGRRAPRPDLAIEIVYSAWRVEKLEVYRGLGIGEVWVMRGGRIAVHRLVDGAYELGSTSALFPALDLDILARCATPGPSLGAAVRAFRNAIAGLES